MGDNHHVNPFHIVISSIVNYKYSLVELQINDFGHKLLSDVHEIYYGPPEGVSRVFGSTSMPSKFPYVQNIIWKSKRHITMKLTGQLSSSWEKSSPLLPARQHIIHSAHNITNWHQIGMNVYPLAIPSFHSVALADSAREH